MRVKGPAKADLPLSTYRPVPKVRRVEQMMTKGTTRHDVRRGYVARDPKTGRVKKGAKTNAARFHD